jgi:hypothetical protein
MRGIIQMGGEEWFGCGWVIKGEIDGRLHFLVLM